MQPKTKWPEPQIVKDYRKAISTPPPRCCHPCEEYKDNGICDLFSMEPPENFASEIGKCKDWIFGVPF